MCSPSKYGATVTDGTFDSYQLKQMGINYSTNSSGYDNYVYVKTIAPPGYKASNECVGFNLKTNDEISISMLKSTNNSITFNVVNEDGTKFEHQISVAIAVKSHTMRAYDLEYDVKGSLTLKGINYNTKNSTIKNTVTYEFRVSKVPGEAADYSYTFDKTSLTVNDRTFSEVVTITAKYDEEEDDDGSSGGTSGDEDDGGSSGSSTTSYKYKIAYRVADGDWEGFVGGVGYSIYSNYSTSGNCSGTVLASGTSSSTGYVTKTISDASVCVKTTSFPKGYQIYDEDEYSVKLTKANNTAEIYLKSTDDSSSGDSSTDEDDYYIYKITYKDRTTLDIIGNVEFSIHPSVSSTGLCDGTPLTTGKSSNEVSTNKTLSDSSVCLKTTKIPSGYKLYDESESNFALTSSNYIATIYLVADEEDGGQTPDDGGQTPDDGGQTPDDGGNNNITSGNINVIILDKNNKVVSGVKYKLCLDIECKNVKYEGNKITHTNMPLGIYYVIVTDVPSKYALPNKVYTSILNKDVVNDDVKIVLEEKVVVPDTFMNASKVFTACGIIGILGGVSLLYLNVKKKKLA